LKEREREREENRGVSGRKRKKDRGLLAKPSSLSSPSVQNRGGIGGRSAGRLRRLPASRGSTAAGDRRKRKRGAMAIYSGAHLGRGRLEEVVPRKGRPAVEVGSGGANGGGGGAIGLCWRLEDGVGIGEKTPVLFIGSLRRFAGKKSPRRWGSPVEAVPRCRPDSRPPAR
jgi:hypothetical protein